MYPLEYIVSHEQCPFFVNTANDHGSPNHYGPSEFCHGRCNGRSTVELGDGIETRILLTRG